MVRLVVLATERAFEIGSRPMLLGSSERCDVCVEGAAPEHARIEGDDIEAIAPCHVGEVSLAPGERRRLVAGCSIELGDARLHVETGEASTSANRFTTRELALRAVDEPKRLWPTVVVVQGVNVGLEVVLREDRTFQVGRGTTCDVALEDVDVSRSHVEIVRRGDAVLLRDLGSARGTFLGRTRLDPKRKALWTPETMVRVGKTVLALASPSWTRRPSSDRRRAADEASGSMPRTELCSAPQETSPAPHKEEAEAILPADTIVGGVGAIAEVPRAEGPPMNARTHVLDRAVLVAMVAVVGLAVMALVWVLWP